jgi:ATP-dependent DNA ligase
MLQVLSTRARKGVIMSDIKVQVCLYAFDMLSVNGRNLLNEQLTVRREVSIEVACGSLIFTRVHQVSFTVTEYWVPAL